MINKSEKIITRWQYLYEVVAGMTVNIVGFHHRDNSESKPYKTAGPSRYN